MNIHADNYGLSIIALRILPNCRDYIRKCLKEGVFYYLNNNYEISLTGDTIKPRNGFVDIINDNFFSLQDGSQSPNISISAIVGKNGDGKSSLIEFMIRLINNFACQKNLNPNGHLVYIEGVCGEMYFRLNRRFFIIRSTDDGNSHKSVEMLEYKYEKSHGDYRIDRKSLTDIEIQGNAFYTFVSNYSHFAYNTEEFEKENVPEAIGGHWLHKVFHKNDAYQTPLNIHPYRYQGNIDINRERQLSMQRLLISIASSINKNGNEASDLEHAANINGKIPYELKLNDIGYSKLQDYTLKKYFEDNSNTNIIQRQIEDIEQSVSKVGELDNDKDDMLICDISGTSLSFLSKNYILKRKMRFFKSAIIWLENQGLLTSHSDLAQLIYKLEKHNHDSGIYIPEKDLSVWKELAALSGLQFLRLSLVFDICKMWNKTGVNDNNPIRLKFDPTLIFKSYDSLSNAEKCCHYIIYKTIEIFATYTSYGNPVDTYSSSDIFFSYRNTDTVKTTLYNLTDAFDHLSKDWQKESHNTLKLRQAFSLLKGRNSTKKLYANVSMRKGKNIVFDKLNDEHIETLSHIETLPPPIFKWEIIYRKKGQVNPIPFSSFSSGEKQKLFFQSAIIYHLRNISSIGEEKIHYHSVNLVFEEIELYFHPEWQRTLIFDLVRSLRNAYVPEIKSVNMIFVTHSPYILSDIPKSNVLFLRDGMPVYEMQENTFGANINSLLKNGFFLPSLPMGEFAYRKINMLFEKLHSGQFDPQSLDQIYAQIMTVGEPAIRSQLMTLLAPYMRLFGNVRDI